MQMVRAQHQRTVHDARPVRPYVPSTITVSGQKVGNIYEGRYSRSRLLRPAHATAPHFLLWPAARETVWFPVSRCPHLSRVPGDVPGGVPTEAAVQGEVSCPDGWKTASAAADMFVRM